MVCMMDNDIETVSVLLRQCEWNPPMDSAHKGPLARRINPFFVDSLNAP